MNYMTIASKYYSDKQATCHSDPSVYENIIWSGDSVSKASLEEHYLDYLKENKCSDIDTRTRELIDEGFIYNSIGFSLSHNAQRNWMVNMRELEQGNIAFPMNYPTNDSGIYPIVDATEFNTMYYTALAAVQGHVVSGAGLKVQVKMAATEEAIDLIQDNR